MTSTSLPQARARIGLLALAYIAFISLGLPDGLLGVAWPSMRADFGLPLDSLGLLFLSTMAGYLTSSFFNGRVLARLGVGGLLAVSCLMTGASLLGYTLAPGWWFIVCLGVVAGLGAGAIDAGINTYIASEHSEGLMQWLHASFGIGITLGPLIMTAGLNLFDTWRAGYRVVGVAQVLLAACFALTASRWRRPQNGEAEEQDRRILDYQTSLRATLRRPAVWLSALLFFIYTGVELTLGHWAYTLLTESRGIPPGLAGLWAGSYWGTFTAGRILAGLWTRKLSLDNLLRLSLLGALLGALLLWWNPAPAVSLLGVVVVGFSIAPIFPGLVSGTQARVGLRHAANTIGMQISAAGLGGAMLPGLAGVLARQVSLEAIPVFMAACILVMLGLYAAAARLKASG
jgi:fucose permease